MKVIVFGGSGFLGSHVADALTALDYEVTVFDIRQSPYVQKGQKIIVGNILDQDVVNTAVADHDFVYNFAGVADIQKAHENPIATVFNNILGNTIILKHAVYTR